MPTDAERREVARRLRSVNMDDFSCYPEEFEGLYKAIGLYDGEEYSGQDWPERLADLIEPSDGNSELCARCDYRDYCDLPKCSEQDGYSFKPKGYVDLVVLADKTIRTARHDMEICGDTVPAWYAAGRLEAVARNIREILEVES